MIKTPLPVVACIVAVLVGCAEMDWTKPGADKAAVARDMDECRGAALGRAAPANIGTPENRTVASATAPSRPAGTSNERFIAEHEDVRRCMSSRGYQLAPATP